MKRHALALLSVLLVAGCATTRSNYYSNENSGDYYYGAGAADVVIDSSRYPYGYVGYGAGFGYGSNYCYPFWCGRYGYGSDFWIPAPQWIPSPWHDNPGIYRDGRVERDRAARSALIRRDTVQAPNSAKWSHDSSESMRYPASVRQNDARSIRSSSARQPAAARSVAPLRQAPMMRSQPAPSRSASPPAAARSAPIPQRQ
ncbi:MAG: hypothetical protein IPP82_04605 [Xanthomonadales bacterium]|nr:hypothetical protein [Xanthomonadales bacterium]